MTKKKALKTVLIALISILILFFIFFFTRKRIAFFVGDLDRSYIQKLDKPEILTSRYRTKVVYDENDNYLNYADLIINHSIIGLEKENVYDMAYDPVSLIAPYIETIRSENVVFLYNEESIEDIDVLSYLRENLADIKSLSYKGSMARSDYGIYREEIGDALIITLNLNETIGFIRSINAPRLAVSYLDAAALERIEPYIVFSPHWDELILERV